MKLEFAPMEGVTNHIFRRVHHELFPGVDRYYTPFIAPDAGGTFKSSYLKGLTDGSSSDVQLIPQILANNAESFVIVSRKLADLGYDEVNLNCGCPSGTVVSKHKGSGMLSDRDSLDAFLDHIFSNVTGKISVKTRLGLNNTEEFPALLDIYNKYPISLLTVHVRDRKGMYKSKPDTGAFSYALKSAKMPLSYNGDIFKPEDFSALITELPETSCVMIGRGAVANPALFRIIKGGKALEREEMSEYHDRILAAAISDGLAPNFAVMRMKELWYYMISMFPDSKKAFKAMTKATKYEDYYSAAHFILDSCDFDPSAGFSFE